VKSDRGVIIFREYKDTNRVPLMRDPDLYNQYNQFDSNRVSERKSVKAVVANSPFNHPPLLALKQSSHRHTRYIPFGTSQYLAEAWCSEALTFGSVISPDNRYHL